MNSSRENSAPRLPYLPALDGLRALAVLAVLLYHGGQTWLPGGFLGVEMFFVISGYLITSLLLAEWNQDGRVDFKSFWLRRARRLFPALIALLVVVVGYAVVFLPAEVATLRGDVLSTASYVNNWHQIFSHQSYFDSVGRPSLLRHMWSLAVEEQFYLVWPLAFSLLMGRLGPRRVLVLILAATAASIVLMAVLFEPNTDPSRVYYGTDTRAAGLLLGVALAYWWRPGQVIGGNGGGMLDAVGVIAFATLGACFVFINEFQSFLYRGGFSLTALATAELLAVAVHPRARLVPRVLSWGMLRWVGLRSYGIYLWHFPVFAVTRPQLDVPLDGTSLLAVRLALTLGIAAASYRWLETPVRNGALGRAWKTWREAQGRERLRLGWRWAAAATSMLALGSTLGVLLLQARPPAPPSYLATARIVHATAAVAPISKTSVAPPTPPAPLAINLAVVRPVLPPVSTPPPTNPPTVAAKTDHPVTAIGDSVMEGVAEELKHAFGTNTIIDAAQGRLPWNTPAIVKNLHATGKIHATVILHIGNNGFLSAEVFHQIMAELKDARQVVVMNVKVPRQWESLNNRMLAAAIKAYPKAVLVDWHGASGARPKLFWNDGMHVRPEGARLYAGLIAQAVGARPAAGPLR
ncbi:MAG: acyltransferase [Pedosphaera sp.]|nr:acyltransferase [Pedosphaera sp.]